MQSRLVTVTNPRAQLLNLLTGRGLRENAERYLQEAIVYEGIGENISQHLLDAAVHFERFAVLTETGQFRYNEVSDGH